MASGSSSCRGKKKVIFSQNESHINLNLSDDEAEEQELNEMFNTQDSSQTHSHGSSNPEMRKNRSDMFVKFFDKVKLQSGEQRAQCKFCEKSYKFQQGGGYGTLKKHVEKKHPVEYGISPNQTQMQGYVSSVQPGMPNQPGLFKYEDKRWRANLAKFVAMEHLSFSFGEKTTLEELVQTSLNPAGRRVPRSSLKRELKNLVMNTKRNLIREFGDLLQKVSICADIWSDHWQTHSYIGVTCHWIDSSWNIQKRLLAYRLFDDRHTADNIFRMLSLILHEYNLVDRIFSVSFDNASSNNATIGDLTLLCRPSLGGRYFHIRCICHVMNLCVQDGLKSLKEQFAPIREALTYLWSHSSIMKKWGKFCKQHNVHPKRFPRDIPTRWNSTYALLQASFDYKDLLCAFFNTLQNDGIHLYAHQWNQCTYLCDMLRIFSESTNLLSGVYYPTSNLVLNTCINIASAFNECINDATLAECVLSMKSKWLKYFREIPELYLLAFVLDPRFKFDMLEEMLNAYYDVLYSQSYETHLKPNVVSMIFELRQNINDIYREYSVKFKGEVSQIETQQSISSSTSSGFSKFNVAQRLLREKSKRPRGSSSSNVELENYLTTSFEFSETDIEDFDILKWWSQKTQAYPILSIIAKEVFACPVSTVAVEQAFSSGGNILDESRSCMRPDSLESQCLLDDWSKAERRTQGLQSTCDLSDEFDTETNTTGTSGGNMSD